MKRLALSLTVSLSLIAVYADVSRATPSLSSRPGAAYTIYLDFDGFNFSGNWGGPSSSFIPGATPAYTGNDSQKTQVWARVAEKYAAFNVNVTTVDPASVGIGDAARQSFYDKTPKVMHTVIGGSGAWSGGGGISFVGTTQNTYSGSTADGSNGYHTNWVFSAQAPSNLQFIGEAVSHENGHGLKLNHEGDSGIAGQPNQEYSSNGNAIGNGSYAPTMGNSYSSQRGTFRAGNYFNSSSNITTAQNDVSVLLSNGGFTTIDDGVGHTFAAATSLALAGTTVNASLAKGVITPNAAANPIGSTNYSQDFFKFSIGTGGTVTLTVNDGGSWITPGTVSPGVTLRSKLNIFSASNLLTALGSGIEAADTLSTTYTGNLAPGDYYAQVISNGGYQSTFDANAKYYEMGSYFLTGSGFILATTGPEPGSFVLLGLVGGVAFGIRTVRRKK